MAKYTDAAVAVAVERARAQNIRLLVEKGFDKGAGRYAAVGSDGKTLYRVNAVEGICTCPAGQNDRLCKHLAAGLAAMAVNRAPRLIARAPKGPDLAAKARTIRA